MVAISQNNAAEGSAHPSTRQASVIHTVYCTLVSGGVFVSWDLVLWSACGSLVLLVLLVGVVEAAASFAVYALAFSNACTPRVCVTANTTLGVNSLACLGLSIDPAKAWGLAVRCVSGRDWRELQWELMLVLC